MVFCIGVLISIWIIIGSSLELPIGRYISLGIYTLIGLALYLVMAYHRKKRPAELGFITLTPDDADKYK